MASPRGKMSSAVKSYICRSNEATFFEVNEFHRGHPTPRFPPLNLNTSRANTRLSTTFSKPICGKERPLRLSTRTVPVQIDANESLITKITERKRYLPQCSCNLEQHHRHTALRGLIPVLGGSPNCPVSMSAYPRKRKAGCLRPSVISRSRSRLGKDEIKPHELK